MLTTEAAIAAIELAVETMGAEYVYDSNSVDGCRYTNSDGTPSCLVGWVIAEALPDTFKEIRKEESEHGSWRADAMFDVDSSPWSGACPLKVSTDNPALGKALGAAQMVQDTGGDWGEALAVFRDVLRDPADRGTFLRKQAQGYYAREAALNADG